MENIIYDKNEEYKKIIKEISEKYGYEEELQGVLARILPAMLDSSSYEEKQLFYSMLRHTPIVTIPKEDEEKRKQILEKYSTNPNKHIKTLDADEGEYGKQLPDGAFCTDPILDENLNIIGTQQYLYIKAIDEGKKLIGNEKQFFDLFGTRIMVPHLIHELGHAWAAEKNPYEIDENGILIQRVGTTEFKYELEKQEDGTYIQRRISQAGLMIEEGLNTNMEDDAVMRFLNIDQERLKELYNSILIPSNYRGLISDITGALEDQTSKRLIRDWRLLGDKSAKDKINSAIEKTETYQNREKTDENTQKKVDLFEDPRSQKLEQLFKTRKNDFFPNKTNMSGIEIIDNAILQFYNIKVNQIAFMGRENGLEYYGNLMRTIATEFGPIINQTGEKLKETDEKNL